MRIFLAGAAGVIGRRLTPLLVLTGHHVTGTTRSAEKAGQIEAMCAQPVVVDVFDAGALTQAAVPRPIIQKINKDVTDMLRNPEIGAKLKAQFVIPVTDTPEEFDNIIRSETAHLAEVFKEAGIGN